MKYPIHHGVKYPIGTATGKSIAERVACSFGMRNTSQFDSAAFLRVYFLFILAFAGGSVNNTPF
jgi:hypothetical protein